MFKNLAFSARFWPGLGLFVKRRPATIDGPACTTFALVLGFFSLELTRYHYRKGKGRPITREDLQKLTEDAYRELEAAFNKYNEGGGTVPGFIRSLQKDETRADGYTRFLMEEVAQ